MAGASATFARNSDRLYLVRAHLSSPIDAGAKMLSLTLPVTFLHLHSLTN